MSRAKEILLAHDVAF